MAYPHPIRHTPHTFRGPVRSSTEGPSGRVRMAYPHPIRHTPHTFRGPTGSSTYGPSGAARIWATPTFRHTSHMFRGFTGSSTEGPSGTARMRALPYREFHLRRYSQLPHSQLHMFGFFARLIDDFRLWEPSGMLSWVR